MIFFQKRLVWFIALCILNILLLIGFKNNINFISKAILQATQFVRLGIGYTAKISTNLQSYIKTNTELKKQNKNLQEALSIMQSQYKSIDSLVFENQQLRELLQFRYSIDYNLVPAHIIISAGGEGHTSFVIDKGQQNKIKEKMIVCGIYGNRLILLGRIAVSNQNSAIIEPLYQKGFTFAISTSLSNQKGLLVGDNKNLSIMFDSLYDADQVLVGEEVRVNEFSTIFPNGIPIGTISNVYINEEDLLVRANVETFTSLTDLDVIFVIIPQELS